MAGNLPLLESDLLIRTAIGCIDRTEFGWGASRFGLFTDAPCAARDRWQ